MTHPALAHLTAELRETSPDDFGPSVPVYVLGRDELPEEHWQDGSLAHVCFDLELQPFLESRGAWIGRGYAAAFDLERIPPNELAGVFMHEASHWLCGSDPLGSNDSEMRLATAAGWRPAEEPLAEFLQHIGPPDESGLPPWEQHGLQFIRAAMHLWGRFEGRVPLASLRLGGPQYGLSDWRVYRGRLEEEVYQHRTGSIRSVLATPCPPKAVELFELDTATH